ncbi:MAG TPA: ABC transporter permease, partial [bacterium]|nr:ABC transporter permease [bacterium]
MNAQKIIAIARKDLSYYFVSPIGYVVLALFFLVTGFFFWLIVVGSRTASMSPVFQNTSIIFLFVTPIITMRLWSEE